jgi:hypothetical protein
MTAKKGIGKKVSDKAERKLKRLDAQLQLAHRALDTRLAQTRVQASMMAGLRNQLSHRNQELSEQLMMVRALNNGLTNLLKVTMAICKAHMIAEPTDTDLLFGYRLPDAGGEIQAAVELLIAAGYAERDSEDGCYRLFEDKLAQREIITEPGTKSPDSDQ